MRLPNIPEEIFKALRRGSLKRKSNRMDNLLEGLCADLLGQIRQILLKKSQIASALNAI